MDTSDPEIRFDAEGNCNHCRMYDRIVATMPSPEAAEAELQAITQRIKEAGRNQRYDCVVGVSGGVDSSYVAYQARQLGLRPLAVHFDNGWNSERAEHNIEMVVRGLDLDLYTYVVDWEEFRDLQRSFFRASVIDIEMLTDHAIAAVMLQAAASRGIHYILRGGNVRTEAILPTAWVHSKFDLRSLRAIQSRHGSRPIRSFPTVSTISQRLTLIRHGIQVLDILDRLPYDKAAAIHVLREALDWQVYGGKHHESVFTRFYQGYILPRKFGVDKRRAHLSTLICSGQMTRGEALRELEQEIYDLDLLTEDRGYVLKKLKMTEQEFDAYLGSPPRPHEDFPSEERYLRVFRAAWVTASRLRSQAARRRRS